MGARALTGCALVALAACRSPARPSAPASAAPSASAAPAPAAAASVPALALGDDHGCVTRGGGLHCWGQNDKGQLGDGTRASRAMAKRVPGLEGVVEVVARHSQTCARTAAGSVHCWGENAYGALGDGTKDTRDTPTLVKLPGKAERLVGGWAHGCALVASPGTEGGKVHCWGRVEGAFGYYHSDTPSPKELPGFPRVTALFSFHEDVWMRLEDGRWAIATPSRLAFTPQSDKLSEVGGKTAVSMPEVQRVDGTRGHLCLLAGTELRCAGDGNFGMLGERESCSGDLCPVTGLGPVVAYAVGTNHTCAIGSDGAVRCWGLNDGRLGSAAGGGPWERKPVVVRGVTGAVAIAASDHMTCAALAGGGVTCWGERAFGAKPDPYSKVHVEPTPVVFE